MNRGENANYQHFPKMFSRALPFRFVNPFLHRYLFHSSTTAFENIVGKGEIVQNEQFLFFSQCFLINQITVTPFVDIFDITSLFAAEFEKPKIGISGKGLKVRIG